MVTLPKLMKQKYEEYGDKGIAVRKKNKGIWKEYTWKDQYEKVKYLCLGMKALGLSSGDRVSIIGNNEPEYFWAELAVQAVGGISVGIFTDMLPPEVKYILEDSGSKFLVAEDQEQVDKALQIKDELPLLKKVIYWDPDGLRNYEDPILVSFDQVTELGKKYEESHPGVFEQDIVQGSGDDIAAIFYTSGTTGLPKGVLVTHNNLLSTSRALLGASNWYENDSFACIVPPAIIVESWYLSARLLTGAKAIHSEEPETLFQDIREISPEIIGLTPRQWESFVSTVRVKVDDAGFLKRFVYHLFLPVGYKVADLQTQKESPNLFWKVLYTIANWLVLQPVRDRLGLAKVRIGITASTALSSETLRYFAALGVRIRQFYGSTEAGYVVGHQEDDIRFETVGTPLLGASIRVSEQGEILIKSDNVFQGYNKKPEATEKAFTNGWFHSGDAGHLNEDGHLIFLDRLTDLGELATGAKYAPQYIESKLRFSPYIKDAIVIGGKERGYVSAIINIDFDTVGKWAEYRGIPYTTFVDLSQKVELRDLIQEDVNRVNSVLPEPSRVRKFVLLHKEFDPDEAELTRTRKLRRAFMEDRYKDLIEAIYKDKTEVSVQAEVTYRDGRRGLVTTDLQIRSIS